jgi:hypothetical protein
MRHEKEKGTPMVRIPQKTLAFAVVMLVLLTPLLAVAGGAWRDKTDALRDSIKGSAMAWATRRSPSRGTTMSERLAGSA